MNLIDNEIKNKIKFLELAKEIGNICEAARIMGFSPPSYYRFKKIYDSEGEEGLRKRVKRKPKYNLRISKEIEEKILRISSKSPKMGSLKNKKRTWISRNKNIRNSNLRYS